MTNPSLLLSLTLTLTVCATTLSQSTVAETDSPVTGAVAWPFPGDVPQASSASPGLAGTQPYDIVRYLMARGPYSAELSADGEILAFRSEATGKAQLYTYRIGVGSPTQITFGRAVTEYHWLPDGTRLLYAADRDGNERESYTLINLDGTRETPIQPAGDAFLHFGGFSSDGASLAFSSTQRNGVDYDVYVQSLPDGAARRAFDGRFGFYAEAWRPDSDQLLISETRGEDGNNLYLLDSSSGAVRTLFNPEVNSAYQDFAWLTDGSGFFLSTNHEREFQGLAFYDLASGNLEWLEELDHDIGNVTLFDNDRYLAWTVNEDGYDRLKLLDRRRSRSLTVGTLPLGVYQLSGARNAARLSIRISGPQTPGEVWTLRPGKAPKLTLTSTLAGIAPDTLVTPRSIRFDTRDGVTVQGLLYEAMYEAGPDARQTPRPLMLHVHGGPTGQARPNWQPIIQYLVGQGYAVFDYNFRGSTGFGKRFARLDNGRLRPNAVKDLEDAVHWLVENEHIDPQRVAIMGGSYGGYLTNAAVGEFPGLFQAAVSFVGVSDWVRALEQAAPALKASDRIEYGDINDPEDRAFFAELSPLAKAARVRTPMVVVHGANDPRDPVTESDALVRTVREQEVEVKYLRFADEGHSLRKLGNRVTAYRTIADFLSERLGATDR